MADLLAEALRTLYAADLDAFMDLRRQLVAAARKAGEVDAATEIGRLRKPTLAAWALNLAAREDPAVVSRLVDLGTRMRDAQARLDTATLTALRPDRDGLLREVVAAAERAAATGGRALSPAAQQDVRATVIAALADEQATQAVASGQLTRALSYSGFGEVDLSEAVVRTSSGAILTVLSGSGGAGAAGERAQPGDGGDAGDDEDGGDRGESRRDTGTDLETLAAALAEAQARLAAAEDAVSRARERAEGTRERLAVVERQLAKAREADERALEAVTDAVRARKEAEAARRTAHEALVQAQADG